jgi:hypothetical protein
MMSSLCASSCFGYIEFQKQTTKQLLNRRLEVQCRTMEAVAGNISPDRDDPYIFKERSDRVFGMAGIRSRTSMSPVGISDRTQGAALPAFPTNAIVTRSVRKTAMTPFRAGKMLALTDSSPHLWFSP